MDLNFLYSQHQLSLIRAGKAGTDEYRDRHFAMAEEIGSQIRDYQLVKGATAAFSWNVGADILPAQSARTARL